MENIIPPVLSVVREVRWRMQAGRSMNESLRQYLEDATSPFAQSLREWWVMRSQGRELARSRSPFSSHYQRALVHLIGRGCNGEPTLEHLTALESEIEKAAQMELELHVATLPFKVLLPLLFFQFPAYLLLLLGPLLRDLGQQMGG
jgi:hypothetical protein